MSLPRLVAVRGNHDAALDAPPTSPMRADIRQTPDWTRGQLTAPQRRFLTELPYLARDDAAHAVRTAKDWDVLRP